MIYFARHYKNFVTSVREKLSGNNKHDNRQSQVFYEEFVHFQKTGELPSWARSSDSFTDRTDGADK